MINNITDEMLDQLRNQIKSIMSSFRLAHTLGVETMAEKIGQIYCPEKVNILRGAALLHDITKELSVEQQKEICLRHGIIMDKETELAQPTHHSITAALLIPEKYPQFATDEIISAVRNHTTGSANMSLCDKIIYLSDYIDFTRTYSECITLRDMFWSVDFDSMSYDEKVLHLNKTVLRSFDLTILDLIANNKVVSTATISGRNSLILEINKG